MKRLGQLAIISAIAFPATAQQDSKPVGEVFASDVSVRGSVVLAAGGTRVLSGSHIEAGDTAALLRLTRGGEVRICPKTGLAVSNSVLNQDLLLGMNGGAIEINYKVGPLADNVVTPDFRLQLVGPGTFHVAIGSSSNGDTCVHSLPGNAASVIVSEMLGTGTYQVRAGDSVTFRGGKLSAAVEGAEACGCPAPPPVAVAEVPKQEPLPQAPPAQQQTNTASTNESPQTHVEMEAPLVYHADADQRAQDAIILAQLRGTDNNDLALQLEPRVDNSTFRQPAKAPKKKNLFARFFSKLFR